MASDSTTILLNNGKTGHLKFPSISIKLDRNNYYSWKSIIFSVLEAFEVDSYVTAKPCDPPKAGSDAAVVSAYNAWKKTDRFVLVWLQSTLSDHLVAYVARASTSYDAWAMLASIFQSQTRARLMQLKNQLQTLAKGSLSMMEYIEKKRSIIDSLAECGYIVSNDDIVACILQGLDASYGPFKTSINIRVEAVSPDELTGLLLHEEEKLDAESKSQATLIAPPSPPASTGSPNANTVTSNSDLRSQHGFAVYYGSNLVSWSSRKQKVVARSSTEAEYRALSFATVELVWLRQLLAEIHQPLRSTPVLLCDNLSATFLANNPAITSKSKHIQLDYHYVREQVDVKALIVRHISAPAQIADIFTKALSGRSFDINRSKLLVVARPSSCGGY